MPESLRPLKSALISVYYKDGLDEILRKLAAENVQLYSTGGTAQFIRDLGLQVTEIADLTGYPSILGGRVKTLHPKVFGGILARRDDAVHVKEVTEHGIPYFDLVLVNLYPFQETVRNSNNPLEIIEKVDVGGPSMLRAGAKNHQDVLVIPHERHYGELLQLLNEQGANSTLQQRKKFAAYTFAVTAEYERAIADWFATYTQAGNVQTLRYGENPHQPAVYRGRLNDHLHKLGGKELSYNNLLDVEAALRLIADFAGEPTFAIIKHTNPCGVATRSTVFDAWEAALASDPVSAFGGILVTNHKLDRATAEKIHEHFYEVLLAPAYEPAAAELLLEKKQRILLTYHNLDQLPEQQVRTILSGTLEQAVDNQPIDSSTYQLVTTRKPGPAELQDLVFGEKVARHLKSNAICLVKNRQLIGGGMGQTSRIDSIRHALEKAQHHGFDLRGAVLASDGFFPFSDSVAQAHKAGIEVILQPGGSIRDEETIQYCEQNNLCLVITGVRHFRH